MGRTIRRALMVFGIVFVFSTGLVSAADLPLPPAGAQKIRADVIGRCDVDWGVWIEVYDPDPATLALFMYVGRVTFIGDGAQARTPPDVAVSIDQLGAATVYARERDGSVAVLPGPAFVAAHDGNWCNVAAFRSERPD